MARRARGDGTIYYDAARGRWIGAVTIAGRRRKVSGKDRTEARAKLRELLAARDTNTPLGDRRMTVADLLEQFLDRGVVDARRRPLAPRTIESYAWASKIITAELGDARLIDLDVTDVERMLDRLATREPPLSSASLRKIRSTLVRALEFGQRRGHVTRNVAQWSTITPSAPGRRPRTALTPPEARRLLDALAGERNGAMFALMLRVGLRPGEAAALHWDDLDRSTLNVTRGIQLSRGRARVVDDLKTSASKRTIELPRDLAASLRDHRKAQAVERLAAASWADERLMFASPTGNVLSPSNVRKHLGRICTAAAVPTVSPNELRHSCASLLADMGVMHEAIADLLGHTTTRMVEQTYRHRLRPVVDVAARADWTRSAP